MTVTIPPHSSSSQIGDMLERDGVISRASSSSCARRSPASAASCAPGTYHLKLGHELQRRAEDPDHAAARGEGDEHHDHRGQDPCQIDDAAARPGRQGSYLARRAARRCSTPPPTARRCAPPTSRASCSPTPTSCVEPISIPRARRRSAAARSSSSFATVNLGYARSKHLTPYDVLIIASMVRPRPRPPTTGRWSRR